MWKSCEVEICPWHEKRSKRKEFHANRKSKKKVYRMDNESENDREKSEDTNIQTNLSCHSYESDNCNKVSSVDVEKESQEEKDKTTGIKKPLNVMRKRPKTAPPSHNQQTPMDAMKALASLDLVSARGLDTADQGPEMLSNSFGSKMVKINKKRMDFVLETERMRKRKQEFNQKVDMDALKIWNDYCEAHEAYQFLRKKHSERYKNNIPAPRYK